MNTLRRCLLKGAGATGTITIAIAAGLLRPTHAIAEWNKAAFDAKNVQDGMRSLGIRDQAESSEILIKMPDIAENGAVVPIEVTSRIPGTTGIAVFAEKNGTPLVASYRFSPAAEGYIATRIKVAATSFIRVVAIADGKSYLAAREVKVTVGGCGG